MPPPSSPGRPPARTPFLFRAVLLIAVMATLYFALSEHPPKLVIDQLGDKAEHVLAFAALTLLASGAFPAASLWRVAERLSFLGALIEVLQGTPGVHRDCDIADWLSDTLSILITAAIIARIRRRYAAR